MGRGWLLLRGGAGEVSGSRQWDKSSSCLPQGTCIWWLCFCFAFLQSPWGSRRTGGSLSSYSQGCSCRRELRSTFSEASLFLLHGNA